MAFSVAQKQHIKHLEWAIWFCQADLSTLRVGDWINVKEDLYEFTDYKLNRRAILNLTFPNQGDIAAEYQKDFCETTTEKEIAQVQGGLRKRLLGFAYSKGEQEGVVLRKIRDWSNECVPVQRLPITSGRMEVGGLKPNQPFYQAIYFGREPNLQRKVELALFHHLSSSGILRGQLRTCPECGRIFLIGRKPRSDQTFQCSLRCSRNAATKRYRQRLAKERGEEVKAHERERSHRRYVAKQRKKFPGRKVRIQRRPRTTNQSQSKPGL